MNRYGPDSAATTSLRRVSTVLLCLLGSMLLVGNAVAREFKTSSRDDNQSLSAGIASHQESTAADRSMLSTERRLRKRHKLPRSPWITKDGPLLKRIVAEVVAERDAQIAAALFEVAKNQPHLQMMVQTLGELGQSSQRLEISSGRLDDAQRRLDSRLGVISEKMSLLESRLGQSERRIEREMTQVHAKLEDFLRGINMPDRQTDSVVPVLKEIQEQLVAIEELLLENQPHNKLRRRSRVPAVGPHSLEKINNKMSQSLSAVHSDVVRVMREVEINLEHHISMLSSDNGVFSCALSRLLDASLNQESLNPADANPLSSDWNSNQNKTKCAIKCL